MTACSAAFPARQSRPLLRPCRTTLMMSGPYPYMSNPHHGAVLAPTARRRQRAVQPPSLTTTIGLGLGVPGQTPISTTSLSSPFSANFPSSPYPVSPGGALRGTSPMSHRGPTAFSTPYNPQQWGPISAASSNPASSTASSTRQGSQATRVVPLAAVATGPDGAIFSCESKKPCLD